LRLDELQRHATDVAETNEIASPACQDVLASSSLTARGLCSSSIGSSGLLSAPALTVKRFHNRSFAGRIGPVIVPTSMALDHKSSQAADRMLARTAGAVTKADRLRKKTKGGNSLTAVTSILPTL
jgi:hypothetical protein